MSALMHKMGTRVLCALIAVLAASSLALPLPASAAAAPNHGVPTIKCNVPLWNSA